MRQRDGLSGLRSLPEGSVISIGNFDGLHIGHRSIISQMRTLAAGRKVCVVTFEPHPLTVLRPEAVPPRLSTLALKQRLMAEAGVDELVILPPSPEVLSMTAEAFWEVLRDDVRPAHIVEGRSFYFGKDRGGTIERLQEWADQSQILVHVADNATCVLSDRMVVNVSSSTVRWLLGYGRVADAATCLGRPYELSGLVVQGFQRGRAIGVPTANLEVIDQLVPADGVYAGQCVIDGQIYLAAVNIGTSPSFDKQRFQIEAHLLDFSGDLYGRSLDLQLLQWVRDTTRFPSIDSLKAQISLDIESVRVAIPDSAGRTSKV